MVDHLHVDRPLYLIVIESRRKIAACQMRRLSEGYPSDIYVIGMPCTNVRTYVLANLLKLNFMNQYLRRIL